MKKSHLRPIKQNNPDSTLIGKTQTTTYCILERYTEGKLILYLSWGIYFQSNTIRLKSGQGRFWLAQVEPFLHSDCHILTIANPTLLTLFVRAWKEKAHQLYFLNLYHLTSPAVHKGAQGNPCLSHKGEPYGRRVIPSTVLSDVSYTDKLLLSVSFAVYLLSLPALTTAFIDACRQAQQFMNTNSNLLHEQVHKIVLISVHMPADMHVGNLRCQRTDSSHESSTPVISVV